MTILSQLERNLFQAAKEHLEAGDDPLQDGIGHDRLRSTPPARRPGLTRRRPAIAASLPMVLAIAVAVAVVAVALTTFHHRHPATGDAVGAGGASSSRAQLIHTLGVLRRPQTKADLYARLPGQPRAGLDQELPGFLRPSTAECGGRNRSLPTCAVSVDKPLIRTVSSAATPYKVGILPVVRQRTSASAERTEGLVITLRGPGIYLADSGPNPTSVAALRRHGLLLSAYGAHGVNRGAIVVPDAVAKVELGQLRLLEPTRSIQPLHIASTSSDVTDNVALFQLTGITEKNLRINPAALARFFSQGAGRGCHVSLAIYELPAVAQMTWISATGKVITHAAIQLHLYVGTNHPVPGTATQIPDCSRGQH